MGIAVELAKLQQLEAEAARCSVHEVRHLSLRAVRDLGGVHPLAHHQPPRAQVGVDGGHVAVRDVPHNRAAERRLPCRLQLKVQLAVEAARPGGQQRVQVTGGEGFACAQQQQRT